MSVRKPIVSGQFYPEDEEALVESIEKSFKSRWGPGRLPGKREKKRLSGVISPHAGYAFSGPGTARVFKEVGESDFPKLYVILGVNHQGQKTCLSDEDWETPLGTVKTDKEFVEKLEQKGMEIDNEAHHKEHSIEVQLPFLQYVSKDKEEKIKIVCMMIADDDYERYGKMIQEASEELEKDIIVICSSDFTHYGWNYGYVPFEGDVKSNMEKLDKGAIEHIKKKDAKAFLEYTEKTKATICGKYGIAVFCWLMKQKKARGELLKYYTSGDVIGDYGNSVGYASVMFR